MTARVLEPRLCQGCHAWHPPLTTCAGGWAPWDGQLVTVEIALVSPSVTLTPEQMAEGADFARVVREEAVVQGRTTKYKPAAWITYQERGYQAEIAASVATGLTWNKVLLPPDYRRKNKPPDIGRNVEVRNTSWVGDPCEVHENDPWSRIVLLVSGRGPTFYLRGWIRAGEAMRQEWWVPDNPAPERIKHKWLPCWCVGEEYLAPLPLPDDA